MRQGNDNLESSKKSQAWFKKFWQTPTLDSSYHCTIASPFLCVCEVSLGIQICGDEETAWILINAELSELDLVVINVSVKAHNNCTHLQQACTLSVICLMQRQFTYKSTFYKVSLFCYEKWQ